MLVGYRTVRDGGLYFLPAFPIIIIVADFLVLLIRRGDGWSRRRNRGSVRQDATGMTWHGIASHRIASRRIASHCTAPHRTARRIVYPSRQSSRRLCPSSRMRQVGSCQERAPPRLFRLSIGSIQVVWMMFTVRVFFSFLSFVSSHELSHCDVHARATPQQEKMEAMAMTTTTTTTMATLGGPAGESKLLMWDLFFFFLSLSLSLRPRYASRNRRK